MTAIGKGDWIECIDAKSRFDGPMAPIVEGAIYRVLAVGPHTNPRFAHVECVFVWPPLSRPAGPTGPLYGGSAIDRFKPIHPGGALTRLLMDPVSDRIEPGVSRKSRQDQPAHDEPVSLFDRALGGVG